MSLGTTYSPAVPVGGAASYKLWLVFTYSNGLLGSVRIVVYALLFPMYKIFPSMDSVSVPEHKLFS